MATHPYCLLPGRREVVPAGLRGVEEAPVRAIVTADATMWVSDAPPHGPATGTAAVTFQRAQRHADVVSAALDQGITPLPLRYGQRFETDERAREYLEATLPHVRSLFARVAGMVEMVVVVAPALKKTLRELEPIAREALDASRRGAGLAYLQRLRDREARSERARSVIEARLDSVNAAVRALVRAEERQAGLRGMGRVAHLINREDVPRYRALVLALPMLEDWQVQMSGPRAPYSFCALEGGGGNDGTFLAT